MTEAVEIIIKGIILGLVVSMPLGPIGIILINRTIKRGVLSGIISGFGLTAADLILAVLAGLGFTVIISFVEQEKFVLSIIAGIVIIAAGIKVFLSNPIEDLRNKENNIKSLWRDFYSVFILAVTNPYTILIFVAFFSGVHVKGDIKPELVPFCLIPGIFIGTIGWWTSLSYFVGRFKNRISLRGIIRINKFAGIIIISIGIIVLLSLFATLNQLF